MFDWWPYWLTYRRARTKVRYWWQRRTMGFASWEAWNLDTTLAEFILPRLRYFKEHSHTYNQDYGTPEEWDKQLDKMIWGFEQIASDRWPWLEDPEDMKKVQEAMELFGKNLTSLWD